MAEITPENTEFVFANQQSLVDETEAEPIAPNAAMQLLLFNSWERNRLLCRKSKQCGAGDEVALIVRHFGYVFVIKNAFAKPEQAALPVAPKANNNGRISSFIESY